MIGKINKVHMLLLGIMILFLNCNKPYQHIRLEGTWDFDYQEQ